jgi:hypothetical protein
MECGGCSSPTPVVIIATTASAVTSRARFKAFPNKDDDYLRILLRYVERILLRAEELAIEGRPLKEQ